MFRKVVSLTILDVCLISSVMFFAKANVTTHNFNVGSSTGTYYDYTYNAKAVSSAFQIIAYAEEDDTYDGFHMQREEEYKEEYGDDHEDAIQDEWEERKG